MGFKKKVTLKITFSVLPAYTWLSVFQLKQFIIHGYVILCSSTSNVFPNPYHFPTFPRSSIKFLRFYFPYFAFIRILRLLTFFPLPPEESLTCTSFFYMLWSNGEFGDVSGGEVTTCDSFNATLSASSHRKWSLLHVYTHP